MSVALGQFPAALGHRADVLAAATLGGSVRLLLPFVDEARTEQGAMHSKTYDPGNLLLEVQLSEPVLQLAIGRLTAA